MNVFKLRMTSLGVVLALLAAPLMGAEYWVSTSGDDANAGTKDAPFRTIGKAAGLMQPGDTCIVRGGTYRETVCPKNSGAEGKPIRFVAAKGETVLLDGTERIEGEWSVYKKGIFKIPTKEPFEQLFVDRKMQIEARWPNMRFEEIWDRSKWAQSDHGSRKDLMVCAELADTGIDWTGAVATINVGHQYKSWTRTVAEHKKGGTKFTYVMDERLGDGKDDGITWSDDYFYLSGKLKALDHPTEWHHDTVNGVLYLYPDDGKSPAERAVQYRKRIYAFDVTDRDYIEIDGFRFFATTFRFTKANHCLVDNCRLLFPSYTRLFTDTNPKGARQRAPSAYMQGDHNRIRNTGLALSNTRGIEVCGQSNTVENCIVHDVNWGGSINYPGIRVLVRGKDAVAGNRVSRCTVYNAGNIAILYSGRKNVIEYNHVYNTGLACRDIAALHTGGPSAAGSVACYNWVHDSTGIGMRGDDQTRGLTFHHNVVWDCRRGLIIKGDHNKTFNNTCYGEEGKCYLHIPTRPEPKKWWTRHATLEVQNPNSLFYNNVAGNIVFRGKARPPKDHMQNNLELNPKGLKNVFVDPEKWDFRPCEGSPLIDAGRVIPGITDGYKGKAPDIGGYEFGGEFWKPGTTWQDDMAAPTLALKLEPRRRCGGVPMPRSRFEKAGLSEDAINRLHDLYDAFWTPERKEKRGEGISKRGQFEKGSDGWKQHHKVVADLHTQAWQELKRRGGGILTPEEKALFDKAVGNR